MFWDRFRNEHALLQCDDCCNPFIGLSLLKCWNQNIEREVVSALQRYESQKAYNHGYVVGILLQGLEMIELVGDPPLISSTMVMTTIIKNSKKFFCGY